MTMSLMLALAIAAPSARLSANGAAAPAPPAQNPAAVPASGTTGHWAMAMTRMPDLQGATGWLNSPALTPDALRGRVVLVDFWTYTCINWRREFPYVRAWANKYRDRGLVVVGVHTPEFQFEKDPQHVAQAVKDIGVGYPVALDSDMAIWRSFGNAYWPAIYLIDSRGVVRYHHFGEGNYEATERAIQGLLAEVDQKPATDLVVPDAPGAEAPANWASLRSPENHVGLARTSGLVVRPMRGQPHTYDSVQRVRLNEWAPEGDWLLGDDSAVLQRGGGRIAYGFHARDLHLVMGPVSPSAAVRFRVLIDGKPPGDAHGADVDAQGYGTVTFPRMYQLIRQPGEIRDRRFEIEFSDPGAEVFSFTFG